MAPMPEQDVDDFGLKNGFEWFFEILETGNYQVGLRVLDGRVTVRAKLPEQDASGFMFIAPVRGRGYFMGKAGQRVRISLHADSDLVRVSEIYVMPLDHAEAIERFKLDGASDEAVYRIRRG